MTDVATMPAKRSTIPLDENIEAGPAMRCLSARHQACVRSLFDCEGNRTAAMRANGYGGGDSDKARANLNAHASKFFSDRKIRAAIAEECRARLDSLEPELIALTMKMARSEKVKPADRLRALSLAWDRSRPIESRLKVEVEHHVTNDERDLQHFLALKRIGAPPDAFLRRFGANGIARVEALVAAEEARRRSIDGPMIDGTCAEVVDA